MLTPRISTTVLRLCCAGLGLATYAAAQEVPAANEATLADLITAIETAGNPSAAVEAYARGHAIAPDSLRLRAAYVRRVVELGAPLMAETQAEELLQQDPENGLAWAVLAACSGAANDTSAALAEIVTAARYAASDPLVQRITGRLLAWYDVAGDARELPAGLADALEQVKRDLGDRREFAAAYRAAREFYEQQPNEVGGAVPPARVTQGNAVDEYDDLPADDYEPTDRVYFERPTINYRVYEPYPTWEPGWSIGVSFGRPWWDNCYPYYWPYYWRPAYPCWSRPWLVPCAATYVRCDRDVHRYLRFRIRPGHRAYHGRELLGVTHCGRWRPAPRLQPNHRPYDGLFSELVRRGSRGGPDRAPRSAGTAGGRASRWPTQAERGSSVWGGRSRDGSRRPAQAATSHAPGHADSWAMNRPPGDARRTPAPRADARPRARRTPEDFGTRRETPRAPAPRVGLPERRERATFDRLDLPASGPRARSGAGDTRAALPLRPRRPDTTPRSDTPRWGTRRSGPGQSPGSLSQPRQNWRGAPPAFPRSGAPTFGSGAGSRELPGLTLPDRGRSLGSKHGPPQRRR